MGTAKFMRQVLTVFFSKISYLEQANYSLFLAVADAGGLAKIDHAPAAPRVKAESLKNSRLEKLCRAFSLAVVFFIFFYLRKNLYLLIIYKKTGQIAL